MKISLGTADRKEAQKRLPAALERWNARLAEWEALANAVDLTPDRAGHLADGWKSWISEGNLDTGGVPASAFSPRTWEARPEAEAMATGRMRAHCGEALRLEGISASPATLPLLFDAMREPVQLAYLIAQRQGEQTRPTEAVITTPPLTKAPEPSVTLLGLFDAWKAVATVKPRTIVETDYVVKLLAKTLGHDNAANIGKDDLRRWRDAMIAGGGTNNGFNNRLSMVRQVFLFGLAEGKLATDPTDGLRLRKSRQVSPLPYSDDEAARILIAARQEVRPSLRWSHWIMAFTGMRAGETLQLLGSDIRREGDLWVIDINEHDPGKSVKTGVRRLVPIHPALIAEGFVDYAQTIAADAPLFPDKQPDKHGNRGGRAWNVIGKWVRDTVKITDPQKAPDHSWRHRVEDELRAVEAPEDARDAILGHARKTTGRQYGVRGEALARLNRYLALIPVPPGVA